MKVEGTKPPHIGLRIALSNREGRDNWSELLEMARRRAMVADKLGYDTIWLGEHHFERDGTDVVPNPVMLGADLAARTERTRIGLGAVTLTLWHPLRLAEDLAMLDHFSNGRLEVAFARGIAASEIVNINQEADRRGSQDTSKAIFKENLEIIKRAWTQERFSWTGERHVLPQPGIKYRSAPGAPQRLGYTDADGYMIRMSLAPRPLQSPMPRLWSVSESPSGFQEAAAAGLGGITWYPTGEKLRQIFDVHRQTTAKLTGVTPEPGENCALLRVGLVAGSDAEAREKFEPAINNHFEYITRVRGVEVWLDEGEDPEDERIRDLKPFDLLNERGHLLVGSPDTVAERMLNFGESHGVSNWLLSLTMPGIAPEAADRSIELFGTEVMPALGK